MSITEFTRVKSKRKQLMYAYLLLDTSFPPKRTNRGARVYVHDVASKHALYLSPTVSKNKSITATMVWFSRVFGGSGDGSIAPQQQQQQQQNGATESDDPPSSSHGPPSPSPRLRKRNRRYDDGVHFNCEQDSDSVEGDAPGVSRHINFSQYADTSDDNNNFTDWDDDDDDDEQEEDVLNTTCDTVDTPIVEDVTNDDEHEFIILGEEEAPGDSKLCIITRDCRVWGAMKQNKTTTLPSGSSTSKLAAAVIVCIDEVCGRRWVGEMSHKQKEPKSFSHKCGYMQGLTKHKRPKRSINFCSRRKISPSIIPPGNVFPLTTFVAEEASERCRCCRARHVAY